MQSSILKYGIVTLGVFFLFSTAEISKEECQRYYNMESHVFVSSESVSLTISTASLLSPVQKLFASTITAVDFAFHPALRCVEINGSPGSHLARQAVPLYLDLSSLRI